MNARYPHHGVFRLPHGAILPSVAGSRLHARVGSRAGFTLIEVLVTLLVMAIVLPAAMSAVSSVTSFASDTRRRSDAAQLADAKLGDLLSNATAGQNGNQSGDFSDQGMPDYQWSSTVAPWNPTLTGLNVTEANVSELDVTVSWPSGKDRHSLTISTLIYPNSNPPSVYNSNSTPSGTGSSNASNTTLARQ